MNQPHDFPVDLLPTPNPDALMFRVREALVPGGTYEFGTARDAEGSPLARRLFAIQGARSVLVGRSHVTFTRTDDVGWPEIVPAVKAALQDFLASGEVAVPGAEAPVLDLGDVESRIVAVIESAIRPALESDGGYIEFVGFHDGIVQVRLGGACGSCPHAAATLSFGVQRYLMEQVPEVQGVERVG